MTAVRDTLGLPLYDDGNADIDKINKMTLLQRGKCALALAQAEAEQALAQVEAEDGGKAKRESSMYLQSA